MTDTPFLTWPFQSTSGPASVATRRTMPNRLDDVVNVRDYGALGDGTGAKLNTRYASLAAAQADYPFATNIATQTIDYCAAKQACNVAFGADGSEHFGSYQLNKQVLFPNGIYAFGADTLRIAKLKGGLIRGSGALATTITADNICLQFDGVWYTTIAEMGFYLNSSGGTVCLDIDGNAAGGGTTMPVQEVTVMNCWLYANGSPYCLGIVRTEDGTHGAQGSECLILRCEMSGASQACYIQAGFNALDNIILGGDMQAYLKDGVRATGGTVHVYGTSFENAGTDQTIMSRQIINGGWDINLNGGGVGEAMIIQGSRTEGYKFLYTAGTQTVTISGVCGVNPSGTWTALTAYVVGNTVVVSGNTVFYCTTAGTSGAAQPTWPTTGSGTIADGAGSLVWTRANICFIQYDGGGNGSIDLRSTRSSGSAIIGPPITNTGTAQTTSNAAVSFSGNDEIWVMDATASNLTLTLTDLGTGTPPNPGNNGGVLQGKKVTVKKVDSTAHTITISGQVDNGFAEPVIAGGSPGWRQYVWSDGIGGGRTWVKIGSG